MVRYACAAQPVAPELGGGGEARVGVVDVLRRRKLLGPRERAVDLLALFEYVPRPDPIALHADGHVRLQPDRLLGVACLPASSTFAAPLSAATGDAAAARIGPVAAVAYGPLGGHPSVVEDRFARQLHLDFAIEAHRDAHKHVVGVLIGRRAGMRRDQVLATARPQDQRLAHDHPAAGGLPGRQQDVGPGLIDARRRHVDPERPETEAAGLAVEQGTEHARGVEARHAQPVDRPIGSDQRAGVAVRQERVVGDRRKGRGHRRALRSPRRRVSGALGLRRRSLGRGQDAIQGPCQPP